MLCGLSVIWACFAPLHARKDAQLHSNNIVFLQTEDTKDANFSILALSQRGRHKWGVQCRKLPDTGQTTAYYAEHRATEPKVYHYEIRWCPIEHRSIKQNTAMVVWFRNGGWGSLLELSWRLASCYITCQW